MPSIDRPPIFVVGCQRSGTTLLRLMLDSHPSISCGPETRFLDDLERITGAEWHRLQQFGFPKAYWEEKIAELFASVHRDYAAARGRTRWADKTPRYALQLDFIDRLFPTSQILHVIRDGRDVVVSHKELVGYAAAVRAAEKWPRYVRAARATGSRLGRERYREVRYEELVAEPEKTMRAVLDFLGEEWSAAVLAPDEAEHDVPAAYRVRAARRRDAAEDDAAIYRSRVGAHRRQLGVVLRLLVRLRQAATLRELGYHERLAVK